MTGAKGKVAEHGTERGTGEEEATSGQGERGTSGRVTESADHVTLICRLQQKTAARSLIRQSLSSRTMFRFMTTFKNWFAACPACPAVPECPAMTAGDFVLPPVTIPLDDVLQMQRLLLVMVTVSAVTVLILMHMLWTRPGVMYQKADLDAFSRELFQGIYSAIEQLEVATASQTSERDVAADPGPADAAQDATGGSELSEILSSVKYLEANQEVIAEGLSKVLELWKRLDESEFELATGEQPVRYFGASSDLTADLPDGDTILNTSDSILVADMDTSSEFEADSFS